MCPPMKKLVTGEGTLGEPATLVCHCLLIETDAGLVLVDTGIGLEDIRDPRRRLGAIRGLLRAKLDPEETAAHQVERLGFARDDVRHIVLTHLDLDHAGGLSDFPRARVHVMRTERQLAMDRKLHDKIRYRPAQWEHGPDWRLYDVGDGEPWLGFEAVRDLDGLPPEILLVPLYGHTLGHAGVAVDTRDGWLLHCGDAYFFHGEMDPDRPWCTPGLTMFQVAAQRDGTLRKWNQRRLRSLVREHGHEVQVFSAHDQRELERCLSARPSARSTDRSDTATA